MRCIFCGANESKKILETWEGNKVGACYMCDNDQNWERQIGSVFITRLRGDSK